MDGFRIALEMYEEGLIPESELLTHLALDLSTKLTDAENAELDSVIRNIGDRETVRAEKGMHRSGHPIPAFQVPPFV